MSSGWSRTAWSKRIFTGLKPQRLGRLIAGLAGSRAAAEDARLRERGGHDRLRPPAPARTGRMAAC